MGSNTTNYNLYKPAVGEQDWGEEVNTSFDTIDTQMKTNADAISLNTTHRSSDGSDHTFIDQSVISGAAPTFTADNFSDGGGNAIITTTQETNFETAYTHVSSDGSDHTFIDQSVISGASPIFDGANITGVDAANVDITDAGAIITATDVEGALAENRGLIDTNTAHSTGDGSDHADVATNTAHSTGDGSDHADVATNTTHSTGDGSDHADVATNSAHVATTHDYSYISGNDGATDVTAAELEELTDGSTTALHTHTGIGTDEAVAIDNAATPGYLGTANNDGVLRTSAPLSYTDGGDFITITLDTTADFDSTGTWQFARVEVDDASTNVDKDGSNNMTFTDAVTGTKTLAELASGGAVATRNTFTDASLSSGVLTITHNKGLPAPYALDVTIFNNNGEKIMPDGLTGSTNSIDVDLTSYGSLTGTWGYVYVA